MKWRLIGIVGLLAQVTTSNNGPHDSFVWNAIWTILAASVE